MSCIRRNSPGSRGNLPCSAGTSRGQFRRVARVWFPVLICSLISLAGCKSHSPSHYVSPRVIGRVLDETTHQPIKDVRVKRVVPDYEAGTLDQVRGGEMLARMQSPRSAADGDFVLDSQKAVALFSDLAWFTVEISFTRSGYETFITNYTPASAVFSPDGEPVIQAGDIFLKPKTTDEQVQP